MQGIRLLAASGERVAGGYPLGERAARGIIPAGAEEHESQVAVGILARKAYIAHGGDGIGGLAPRIANYQYCSYTCFMNTFLEKVYYCRLMDGL